MMAFDEIFEKWGSEATHSSEILNFRTFSTLNISSHIIGKQIYLILLAATSFGVELLLQATDQ